MFWEKEIETASRSDLRRLQLARLKKPSNRQPSLPLTRRFFKRHRVFPDRIKTLEDIRRLLSPPRKTCANISPSGCGRAHGKVGAGPFLVRDDRQGHGGFPHLQRPGGLGQPDRPLHVHGGGTAGGCFPEHRRLRLFTGGLGFHYGARAARRADDSGGKPEQQAPDFSDAGFRHDGFPHHPQLCPASLEGLRGDEPEPEKDTRLRIALIGAEPHSDATRPAHRGDVRRQRLQLLRLSEMNGPGVAFECPEKSACISGG